MLVIAFVAIELYTGLFHSDLRARTPGRNAIVFASLAMFALGFWDDVRPLGAKRKLAAQVLIAGAVCFSGIGIESWRAPYSHCLVHLGVFGPVITIVWLVALTNLINLIDGVDGLAGGICFMLMILIATVAHSDGNFELLACGMAGALLGFLCFNFPPARIYLGDGGAYFLGFQIGLYSIINSHKGTILAALIAPVLVLAFPIADALLTFVRRGLRGLPLFRPDRQHLHHRLIRAGCSRRQVVLWLYALNLVCLLMALAAFWSKAHWMGVLTGGAVVLLWFRPGSRAFSPSWFAIHRVVRSCLRMRGDVRYALCLARLLELEGYRCAGPDQLWPDLVVAADKLGFASMTLTLQQKKRVWSRQGLPRGTARCYQAKGRFGTIEFTTPDCPLSTSASGGCLEPDEGCVKRSGRCLADPRRFETISDLLAEAWNKAAAQWRGRQIPIVFQGTVPQTGSHVDSDSFQSAPVLHVGGRNIFQVGRSNEARDSLERAGA
jgi:UDP-GlcNAc:undecaprenyl-phosphate GlcNAc-1-phosphate transferase